MMYFARLTSAATFHQGPRSLQSHILRSLFLSSFPKSSQTIRFMATIKDSIPHVVRTADDPRQGKSHRAIISRIEIVNKDIRLFRLSLPDGSKIRHLPGQYVDLQLPEVERVGGFTITSPPHTALIARSQDSQDIRNESFVELAVQRADSNPPAQFLHRDPAEIINSPVTIQIGGSFTYPPYSLSQANFKNINNVVFIAGGVGINPIISMVSAMDLTGTQRMGGMLPRVRVLYSSRQQYVKSSEGKDTGEEILFHSRLTHIAERWRNNSSVDFQYTLFETSKQLRPTPEDASANNSRCLRRRMSYEDLIDALGPEAGWESTLVYVCGHPKMTDDYIEYLRSLPGLDEQRVLCEKWW